MITLNKLVSFIIKLMKSKFHGEVTIRFKAGNMIHVKEVKSYLTL